MAILENKSLLSFHQIVEGWIDGISSLDVRYISVRSEDKWYLMKASMVLRPSLFEPPFKEEIQTKDIKVGIIRENFSKKDIKNIVKKLYSGELVIPNFSYNFPSCEKLDYYAPFSEESNYFQYQIKISGQLQQRLMFSHIEHKTVNAQLRCLKTPFDGMADIFSFAGFQGLNQIPGQAEISLEIEPPVALVISECRLENNKLTTKFIKHAKYPSNKINVALRLFPTPSLDRRFQIGEMVKWKKSHPNGKEGTLSVELQSSATVEVMLSASGHSISRYFVIDKNKSLNPRLTNYTKYDCDLKVLREKLFCAPKDSRHLETGVASLAYLLGFTTFKPPLDDAPDLVIETKQGRVAIIECTTRVTDIRVKAGKLVHRKYLLKDASRMSNFTGEILTILVVNIPKEQIVDETLYLTQNEVLLMTKEDLESLLNQLEVPSDTDQKFNEAREKLRNELAQLKDIPQLM